MYLNLKIFNSSQNWIQPYSVTIVVTKIFDGKIYAFGYMYLKQQKRHTIWMQE